MNLYEKLTETFREIAEKNNKVGDVIVLGTRNNVPEMLAEAAIKVVYEHQNQTGD